MDDSERYEDIPFCPLIKSECKGEYCAWFHDHEKIPGCAILNLSKLTEDIRFHINQMDMQGIGVYQE